MGTHLWALQPTNVNYTARIGGLYGTLMRAEVLLPAKIHYPAFIRKFSKHYFYKIKSCGIANKSGEICLGEEHVVSLYGCSAAFLLLEIIIKKDENGEKNLANAIFQLLDKDKNVVISELITDKNGEVVLENILPGTYYIKEIQAPAGYILYDSYIQIRPEFNEELTVTIKNSKEEKPEIQISENGLKIKNEVKRLPKTGM